jgi:hypothetical protein
LKYDSYIEKVFTEKSYLLWRFLAFGPNDGCYGHIHGIVCSNVPIFYTNMHLGSTDNVDEESFPFHCTEKPFSIFRVWKMGFFVKHQPQICCKTWELHFLKILDHVICTNNQIVGPEKVSIHLFWKTQVSADSVGNGSNLNYRCLVVCSWFLAKIIFRYTTTYFIRDTPRVSQYSTPSYERSCPPSWLFFEIGIENSKKFKKMVNSLNS